MLPLSVVTAGVMVVLWFPLSTLWHQQSQLDTTAAQIAAVQRQSQALLAEAKSVSTRAAAIELARAQYQLVEPGQRLIQVLPGNGSGTVAVHAGDPGFQPLVDPLSAGTVDTGVVAAPHRGVGGYLGRLLRTLEFWR
jgi:ABC-type transporter Mla subunit MlaD